MHSRSGHDDPNLVVASSSAPTYHRVVKIHGRVLDSDGRPAGGVEVRVTPGDDTMTTGSDGTFAFERSLRDSCHVIAQKDDWYAGPLLVWPTDTDAPIELALPVMLKRGSCSGYAVLRGEKAPDALARELGAMGLL